MTPVRHRRAAWLCAFLLTVTGCGTPPPAPSSRVTTLRAEVESRVTSLDYTPETAATLSRIMADQTDILARLSLQAEFIANRTRAGEQEQARAAEKVLARRVADIIQGWVTPDQTTFDLTEVMRKRGANCLGCTQMFFVLGGAAGLAVTPVSVLEFRRPGLDPHGFRHVCCLVTLGDGTTLMVNPAAPVFVSRPFVFDEVYVRSGNYYRLRDPANPLDLYRRIQLLDPQGLAAHVHNSRGAVLAARNRTEEALAQYREALILNPLFAETWNNRAVALSRSGDPNRALSSYSRALALDADYAEAYYNRANAYGKLGQYRKAIDDYSRAIQQRPEMDQAYANRALCYASLGDEEAARRDSTRAAQLNPRHSVTEMLRQVSGLFRPRASSGRGTGK